jgi:hypothetical protein
VAACTRATEHDVAYIGPDQAAQFLAKLAAPDEIVPMLAPGSVGANRNLLLLMTAGELLLTIDDDVVCETWAGGDAGDGLGFMGHNQERFDTAFFASRTHAFDAVTGTGQDLLAAHSALLGHAVAELIGASSRPVDLAGACAHLRSSIDKGRHLAVKATCAGVAGDAGVYCPYRLLFSVGPLRGLLLSSVSTFQTAMMSREASRIVRTNIVTHDPGVMGLCMGVANRDVVPPFLPIGRNEDGVFGVMLAAADRSAVFGHVPVGVLHDSDRPSERPDGEMRSATESRLADVIIPLVRHTQVTSPATCERWLHDTGQRFIDLANRGWHDVRALVAELIREERRVELEYVDQAISEADCPRYWRDALVLYRDRLTASMANQEFFLPVEFHRAGTAEEGYRALQASLLSFGRLLATWPALWNAARSLKPA